MGMGEEAREGKGCGGRADKGAGDSSQRQRRPARGPGRGPGATAGEAGNQRGMAPGTAPVRGGWPREGAGIQSRRRQG